MDQVLLDSFQENLALIHPDGKISATNLAWEKFALENGADPSWYLMRVTPLQENGKITGAVISHRNIF